MDENAAQNIQKKLIGLFQSCEMKSPNILGVNGWENITKISAEVCKHKGAYIDGFQVASMIVARLQETATHLGQQPEWNGKLPRDSVEGLALKILNRIKGIPYDYDVFFELPSVKMPVEEFEVSNFSSLQIIKRREVKRETVASKLGFVDDSTGCYFRTRLSGYIDGNGSGPTVQRSLTTLKTFIERGISSKVFVQNYFLSAGFDIPQKSELCARELSDGAEGATTFVSIPKDVVDVLGFIQVSASILSGSEFDSELKNGMRDYVKLVEAAIADEKQSARLIAACEWGFDANSEHVPAMSVVKTCIALESIFGDENGEGSITKSLSDRCAYSLALDMAERKSIMDNCKRLYQLRSKIVHGVKRELSTQDMQLLTFGKDILQRSIDREIKLLSE